MKKLMYFCALLAAGLLAIACDKNDGDPMPDVSDLQDQLEVDGRLCAITYAEEYWYTATIQDHAVVGFDTHDDDDVSIQIRFPINSDQHIKQGFYSLVSSWPEGDLSEGICMVTLHVGLDFKILASGEVRVFEAGDSSRRITLEGIDSDGKSVRLGWDGELNYQNRVFDKGVAAIRVDDGTLSQGVGVCLLGSYGWVPLSGLHSTEIILYACPKGDYRNEHGIILCLFHDAPYLPMGTFTFPSTGSGTFHGEVHIRATYCDITEGKITIGREGESYLISLEGITMVESGDRTQSHTLEGTYSGAARIEDFSHIMPPEPMFPNSTPCS